MGEETKRTALSVSRQVRRIVEQGLRARGFAPRGGSEISEVYVRHRIDNIEDVITLPVDIVDNESPIFVTANVGIHCPSLAPLVEQFSRGRYIPSAARLTRNIGDLMPSRRRWHGWQFSVCDDPQPQALALTDAIVDVGIGWIEQFDRLEAVRLPEVNQEYTLRLEHDWDVFIRQSRLAG